MAKVTPFISSRKLVDANGVLTQEGRLFFDAFINRIPITGTGSPEGVVEARAGATYYDLAASTGSIHYIKKVDEVDDGGATRNKTKGWELA